MQVSVESIGKLERRMQVQVPAERVSKEIATRLKQLSRTARLNGFRPGKAPLTVIRQQFGQQVHREVIGELLQSSFAEARHPESARAGGQPAHRAADRRRGPGPDLRRDLRGISGSRAAADRLRLSVERVTAEVTESDVDAMIERLRKQQMKYAAVTRAAASGDKVTVDFEGSIDGVPFAGGKGENVAIVLGEGRMLAQLEQGLVGAAAGEEKRDRRGFSRRLSRNGSRRQACRFQGRREERRGAFAAGARRGVLQVVRRSTEGGVPKLREEVAANMRRELDQALRNRNKAAVHGQALSGQSDRSCRTPCSKSQIQNLQVEAMRRSGAKDASQAPPREPLVEPARRRAALGLLVNDIIRRESIVLDPKRSNARLDEMVGAYGDAAALKRAYLQNADAMRQVREPGARGSGGGLDSGARQGARRGVARSKR